MIVDKDSVVSNGLNLGPFLVEAKFGYHKLWANDSGRNLAGDQSGTLLGIFPKLTLQFRKLTKTELELVVPILDSARQETKYYDSHKKAKVTMTTYTGDYEITNKSIINENQKNEGFSVAFISVSRRQ